MPAIVTAKTFSGLSKVHSAEPNGLADVLRLLAVNDAKRVVVTANVAAITDNSGAAAANGTVELIPLPVASVASANAITAINIVTLLNAAPADGDTVVVNGKTYTFKTALVNTDGFVLIGASLTTAAQNLTRAINLGGVAGTNYAAATTLHPTVSAVDGAAGIVNLVAKTGGTAGNSLTLAKTFATGANCTITGATFAGGADTGGAQKAAFETAAGKLLDAITELGAKTAALATVLPTISFTDNSGGTAADGTIAALDLTVSAVSTSFAAAPGVITFATAARDALATIGVAVNALRTSVGLSAITLAGGGNTIFPMVIPALSTATGTAAVADATANVVSAASASAFLTAAGHAVKELAAGLNGVRAVTAPAVATVLAA